MIGLTASVEMRLLVLTILLVCFTYGVFASPASGYEASKQLIHRSRRSDCPRTDCEGADEHPCQHCGCIGKKGRDVCENIRCANYPPMEQNRDCTRAKEDPCNHCGCKNERGEDVCAAILCQAMNQ